MNNLDDVDELTRIYKSRNDYLVDKLKGVVGVRVIPAQGGFYLVIDCEQYMYERDIQSSFHLARDLLEKTGVAVVPGSDFGCEYGIRISFTNLRFKEAVDRMASYFSA